MDFPNGEPLHAVQQAAFDARGSLRGAAYFLEQGLGKTGLTLRDFQDKVDKGLCSRMVIICPQSFKGGWVEEMEKWGFEFDPYIYNSAQIPMGEYWMRRAFDKPPVLIINVESIRLGGTKKKPLPSKGYDFVKKFMSKRTFLVLDESIQISTYDSMTTKGALDLSKEPEVVFRRILSGKPMKQGPHDLWSQYRFLGELNGTLYSEFKHAYARMGGFQGKQVVGAINEDILAERTNHFIFRATKADWTDLPPKVYTIREHQLGPEAARHYKTMEEEFVAWLENDKTVTINAAISKYGKLAQIQSGFIFDEDRVVHTFEGDNGRLKALEDFIKMELSGKIIVVYTHKPVGEQLARHFAEMQPAFIRGGMTTEEVEADKRRFNTDPKCRMILITKAAKYGHTLLGDQTKPEDSCNTMAFYENTYSLDDRSQEEDRAHRHGQIQKTMDYVDFCATDLDRNCIHALQRKEEIFQTIFSKIQRRLPVVTQPA